MATHSSVLSWRIPPWRREPPEKPGRLQSTTGPQSRTGLRHSEQLSTYSWEPPILGNILLLFFLQYLLSERSVVEPFCLYVTIQSTTFLVFSNYLTTIYRVECINLKFRSFGGCARPCNCSTMTYHLSITLESSLCSPPVNLPTWEDSVFTKSGNAEPTGHLKSLDIISDGDSALLTREVI